MGTLQQQIDLLNQKVEALKTSQDAVLKIQGQQAIFISTLIRKGGITNDEVREEAERLNTESGDDPKNTESSEVQSKGSGAS